MMGDKYPSKTSKTPPPPPSMTYAQQIEWDKRHPKEKQPFGYSFYKNPWKMSVITGLLGLAAGGPQKAKRDEAMRLHEEKRRAEEELRLREEKIRKANAAKERSRQIHAEAEAARKEQEETDRYYEELDRKNREEEGQGHAI